MSLITFLTQFACSINTQFRSGSRFSALLTNVPFFLGRCHETTKRETIKVKQESKMRTAQRKPKELGTSWSPFRLRKDKKDAEERCELPQLSPTIDFEPKKKPSTTIIYSEETSDIATPVSPDTLRLLEAIREDELEIVEDELASLTDRHAINRTDRHGFALIHVAARYNLRRIVNTLLEHGADVNIGTSECLWTPLHLAARCVMTYILFA